MGTTRKEDIQTYMLWSGRVKCKRKVLFGHEPWVDINLCRVAPNTTFVVHLCQADFILDVSPVGNPAAVSSAIRGDSPSRSIDVCVNKAIVWIVDDDRLGD